MACLQTSLEASLKLFTSPAVTSKHNHCFRTMRRRFNTCKKSTSSPFIPPSPFCFSIHPTSSFLFPPLILPVSLLAQPFILRSFFCSNHRISLLLVSLILLFPLQTIVTDILIFNHPKWIPSKAIHTFLTGPSRTFAVTTREGGDVVAWKRDRWVVEKLVGGLRGGLLGRLREGRLWPASSRKALRSKVSMQMTGR